MDINGDWLGTAIIFTIIFALTFLAPSTVYIVEGSDNTMHQGAIVDTNSTAAVTFTACGEGSNIILTDGTQKIIGREIESTEECKPAYQVVVPAIEARYTILKGGIALDSGVVASVKEGYAIKRLARLYLGFRYTLLGLALGSFGFAFSEYLADFVRTIKDKLGL